MAKVEYRCPSFTQIPTAPQVDGTICHYNAQPGNTPEQQRHSPAFISSAEAAAEPSTAAAAAATITTTSPGVDNLDIELNTFDEENECADTEHKEVSTKKNTTRKRKRQMISPETEQVC